MSTLSPYGATAESTIADSETWDVVHATLWTWAAIAGLLLVYRWTFTLLHHTRRMVNLGHDGKQRYFTYPNDTWAALKRRILIAPLFRNRHKSEFKLSAATNVGTLPSRFESLILVGYFIMNIVTMLAHIDWSSAASAFVQARSRAGALATLNLVPLFLLAGRNNPLIWLLGISFNTYNLLHRWIGRIVVVEAFAHAAFWALNYIQQDGWSPGWREIGGFLSAPIIYTGLAGLSALVAILVQSPSIIRHAFYETFLHIHILLAITTVVTVWMHLVGFPQQTFLAVALVIWAVERSLRMWSLVYRNVGNGVTKAEIETLPGGALRVTLRMIRPWNFRPGQHIYMYIPSIGMWTSHPFSLAWSRETNDFNGEKALPLVQQDLRACKTTHVSLIIRRRTGFTNSLYQKADRSPAGRFVTTAFVEGPYGDQTFYSYGTVVLFAGGVGITHQLPHARALVESFGAGTSATRRVALVWVIQSPEHLEWIRPWITEVLELPRRRDILRILLYVTQPGRMREVRSPSSSVHMFPGRPDVGAILATEQTNQIGAMAVSVCGTGSLSDSVRSAVRQRCQVSEMDFFDEAFSW